MSNFWDTVFNLISDDHPRIKRQDQDFAVANPPGPTANVFRMITQNLRKPSPNTVAVLNERAKGNKDDIVWISRQPGLGESQRQLPLFAAKVRQDRRGQRSGELIRLGDDQRVLVEYPEEITFEDLAQIAEQEQFYNRPERARVVITETGERTATTEQ